MLSGAKSCQLQRCPDSGWLIKSLIYKQTDFAAESPGSATSSYEPEVVLAFAEVGGSAEKVCYDLPRSRQTLHQPAAATSLPGNSEQPRKRAVPNSIKAQVAQLCPRR